MAVRSGGIAGAAAVATLVFALSAAGTAGDLDPTFAGKGWVRTYELVGSGSHFAHGAEDVALQPDGKIVAVGPLDGYLDTAFGAFRYTPNGGLDRSFGGVGWVATAIGSGSTAHAVALQRDGKIVLAGEVECPFGVGSCGGLARYLPSGTLDPSFGDGGVVRTAFIGARFHAVAVQPDGRVVAAGKSLGRSGANFGVARFLPDGRLDRSFSGDGFAKVPFAYGGEGAEALALQHDGKIVVAGGGGVGDDFVIARLLRNGRLDRSFSRDGRVFVSFGRRRSDVAHALALQRDGKIVVAGESRVAQVRAPRMALARLSRKGALDRSFGTGGRRLTSPGPFGGLADAVLALAGGRTLVAGLAYDSAENLTSDWALVRYTAAGGLDGSFGRGGIVVDSFGTGADWAGALARQPNAKIVAAGAVYDDQAVARFLPR